MKRLLALALILALLLSLGACAAKEEKVELTVFAAASLQETLTETTTWRNTKTSL